MNATPEPRRHLELVADPEVAYRREWLVTNGLGGYAAGTVGGVPTRRYHGLLIASLPNPAGRVMMLSSLAEGVRFPDRTRLDLGWVAPVLRHGTDLELVEFDLELGLPVWRFAGNGIVLERRLTMTYGLNTTVITYRLVEGGPVRLELRPALQFRGHDEMVSTKVPDAYPLEAFGARIELDAPDPLPNLRFRIVADKSTFVVEPRAVPELAYVTEESRGYDSRGQLYSPGRFRAELEAGQSVSLIASAEPWETV
ncbi:MAG: glycogen debranching enzyme N-terminal domain-containing protein, partial [Polyangiales bacterium]